MTKIAVLVLLITASTLAGCSNQPPETPPEFPEPGPEPPPSDEENPLPPDNSVNNATSYPWIKFSQCTGFIGSTLPYPRSLGPGQTPPGWEPEDPSVLSSYVFLTGYDCQRIHIGPYERGPVRFVWDGHDNADAPPKCSEGRPLRHFTVLLNAILINDKDLADYMKNELGMPAEYADIEIETEVIGSLKQHTWSWGPETTLSHLRITDDETSAPYDNGERLFWQKEGGIGMLDLSYTREKTAYTSRDGQGTMEPPMLLAEETTNNFVGPINYFHTMDGEGEFQLFEDLLCEKPVSRP